MATPNTVSPSTYGPILPTTIAKADDVLNAAAKAGHKVPLVYGYNSTPDHNNLKCIDFMHYGNVAIRDWLVNYLRNNAKRLGVCGIISNGHVMGFPSNGPAYRGPENGWRTYAGPNPHTDHVHVEFNTAALPAAPKPVKVKPRVIWPKVKEGNAALSVALDNAPKGSPLAAALRSAIKSIAKWNR